MDLAKPSQGIQVAGPGATPLHVLAIQPVPAHACQIDDQFARGSDLMVRYLQSEHDQFAFQVDLRAVPDAELGGAAAGFDCWLSVQTQLLDSHPTLEISHPSAKEGWKSVSSIQLYSATGGSLAVLIHPSDLVQTELLDSNAGRLRLFGNFMEKGVIRRGRIRCLVSTQPLSESNLQSAYESFAASPLPLTT